MKNGTNPSFPYRRLTVCSCHKLTFNPCPSSVALQMKLVSNRPEDFRHFSNTMKVRVGAGPHATECSARTDRQAVGRPFEIVLVSALRIRANA